METSLIEFDESNVQDMISRLTAMKNKLDIVQRFFREIMISDVDFGTIPGTPKPSLYKPGAEKLCELYGFAIEMADKREERDYKTGFYLAEVTVRLRHRGTGQVVAEGVGEANVYESRYRYRWVYESDLPKGMDASSLLSKDFENKTTGSKWTKYRVENTDLFDQWNTVLKIAKKRALVDATLSATRSSGIFTQSEDDFEAYIMGEDEVPGPGSAPAATKNTGKPSGITINFGKHKGKTLEAIFKEDPSYLEWLVKNAKEEKVREASNRILTAKDQADKPDTPSTQTEPGQTAEGENQPSKSDEELFNEAFPGGE